MSGRLPTFLGIGAPRCGTTWLYEQLNEHPEAFVSEIKELSYFMPNSYRSNWSRGIEWYKGQFPESEHYKALGEVSPRYYFTHESPAAIHSVVPDVKIIFILRNPAEMLQSLASFHANMYPHAIDRKFYSLHDYLDHHFIEQLTRFHFHLTRFSAYFNADQLLVILQEDVRANPPAVLEQIANHLNINPNLFRSDQTREVNSAEFPKSFTLANLVRAYKGPGRYHFRAWEKSANRITHPDNVFRYSPEQFESTLRIYQDDTQQLAQLLNRNLDHWLSFDHLPPHMKR